MLTFGADPEIFASYKMNNKLFCYPPIAFKRVLNVPPRIDDKKHPVYIERPNYNWIQDGVAFELTLKEPFTNAAEMFSTMEESFQDVTQFLREYQFNFCARPVINFDPNLFYEGMDEEFQQCVIFGCDPDKDAIETNYICETFDVSTHPYRYGGGHFHIGTNDSDEKENIQDNFNPFIKLLAITVGNICISNSKYIEEEKLRSFHYGKPGRYRIQPHGIEYRTPSNSWIENKNTLELMMEGAKKAFYWLNNPKEGMEIIKEYLNPTIFAIKDADQEESKLILEKVL